MGSIRTFRWVLAGTALVAGLVLLVVGSTVAGTVITVLALVRLAFLVTVSRRRGRLAESHPGAGRRAELVRREVGVAAGAIGLEPDRLRAELAGGRSVADVAAAHGVARGTVVDAVAEDLSVAVGRARGAVRPWAERLVDHRAGEDRRLLGRP